MARSMSNKGENHYHSSTREAGQNCDEELAFSRSHLALSVKTAVQLLCLQAISWASKQANKNLINGSGKKALDIGCAYGYIIDLLSELKYETIGLDLSRYALKTGRRTNRIQGDAQSLPFKSNSISIITCFDTLEHLSRPELLLDESHRCLHEEGLLIIENPIANPVDLVSDKLHKMDEIHTSLLAHSEIMLLVKKAGFSATAKGLLPIPFQRFPLFGRFIEIKVPTSMARRILIVAIKSGNSKFQRVMKRSPQQKEANLN